MNMSSIAPFTTFLEKSAADEYLYVAGSLQLEAVKRCGVEYLPPATPHTRAVRMQGETPHECGERLCALVRN